MLFHCLQGLLQLKSWFMCYNCQWVCLYELNEPPECGCNEMIRIKGLTYTNYWSPQTNSVQKQKHNGNAWIDLNKKVPRLELFWSERHKCQFPSVQGLGGFTGSPCQFYTLARTSALWVIPMRMVLIGLDDVSWPWIKFGAIGIAWRDVPPPDHDTRSLDQYIS